MKATLPNGYRDLFTVNELEQARNTIRAMKDDESTAKDYAITAADHYMMNTGRGYINEIIKADATVMRRGAHQWEAMGTGTGFCDVMVKALASAHNNEGNRMYIEFYAMLSDIWKIGDGADYTDRIDANVFE